MKRKLTLMLALLFVWTGVAWSQGVTVKGVVTSEEDGLPIVGASVLVKVLPREPLRMWMVTL